MALVAALAVGMTACGAGDSTAGPASSDKTALAPSDSVARSATESTEATSIGGQNLFPMIEVADATTGDPIDLADELGGGDLPVLLWFWAPH